MNGILVVDKPADWTSFDVIARLRRLLGERHIGHAGTLDPMATGVLPVFIGPAARAVDMQDDHTKEYIAGIRFGLATDTGDTTGTVLRTSDKTVSRQDLLAVLPHFIGPQMQLPPMYSAIKVNGQPLYRLARQGKSVQRTPRPITIYELELLAQSAQNTYTLRVLCSRGSYVRVLLEDIGEALCCPAAMCSLRRTRSGCWRLCDARTLQQLEQAAAAGVLAQQLLGVDTVFAALPAATLEAAACARLQNGAAARCALADGRWRLYGPQGDFLGVGLAQQGRLQAEKLFIERRP